MKGGIPDYFILQKDISTKEEIPAISSHAYEAKAFTCDKSLQTQFSNGARQTLSLKVRCPVGPSNDFEINLIGWLFVAVQI